MMALVQRLAETVAPPDLQSGATVTVNVVLVLADLQTH